MERPKPAVGISSCLLGELVRYDGGHQNNTHIQRFIAPHNQLVTFCPEVHAGLGTPRPPVELIAISNTIKAIGRDDSSLDVTDELAQAGSALATKLRQSGAVAYIFKARSPSCGVNTAPLFNTDKIPIATTYGLAADAIRVQLPEVILTDESNVNSEKKCLLFNQLCQYALAVKQGHYIQAPPWLELNNLMPPSKDSTATEKQQWWLELLMQKIYPLLNDK